MPNAAAGKRTTFAAHIADLIERGEAGAPYTLDDETVSRIIPWRDRWAVIAARPDGDGAASWGIVREVRSKAVPSGARLLSRSEMKRMLAAKPERRTANESRAERLAAEGQGGESMIAHVTPGEIVLPQALQTRRIMAAIADAAHELGIDPARLVVGQGKINPDTGQEQFASSRFVRWKVDPPSNVPNHVFTYRRDGTYIPNFSRPPNAPISGTGRSGGEGTGSGPGGVAGSAQEPAGGSGSPRESRPEDLLDRMGKDQLIELRSQLEELKQRKGSLDDTAEKAGIVSTVAGSIGGMVPGAGWPVGVVFGGGGGVLALYLQSASKRIDDRIRQLELIELEQRIRNE